MDPWNSSILLFGATCGTKLSGLATLWAFAREQDVDLFELPLLPNCSPACQDTCPTPNTDTDAHPPRRDSRRTSIVYLMSTDLHQRLPSSARNIHVESGPGLRIGKNYNLDSVYSWRRVKAGYKHRQRHKRVGAAFHCPLVAGRCTPNPWGLSSPWERKCLPGWR